MTDRKGQPLNDGDRVIPIASGFGIPFRLCCTEATVTGFDGRRVLVRFDGHDRTRAVFPRMLVHV